MGRILKHRATSPVSVRGNDNMNEERTLTPAQRKAWRALYEAHGRATRRIEHALAIAGVGSLSDYAVLFTLYESPDRRVRLSELADAAMLSRSGLTRLVTRLETLGYLTRASCASDRRGTFAVLTDAGVAEMRRIWAVYSPAIAGIFGTQVSDAELDAMTVLLRRTLPAE